MIVRLVVALATALAVGACPGGGAATGPTGPGSGAAAATGDDACPVAVPGTSVTVEDTDTGAALVFVTTGDVAAVRTRTAAMAKAHADAHAKMGPLPTGAETGGGMDHAGMDHAGMDHAGMDHAGMDHAGMDHGTMIGVHSNATAEDIDGGARVVFVAAPADVAGLRDELRMHAQHLASGTCAMDHH